MPKFRYRVFYVTADDTSLVIADVLLRRNQSQRSCFAVAVYGCGCLGRNKLIITRAVRHLAITTFGNDRWQHDLWQFRLDVAYLDIYLFYVYGLYPVLTNVDIYVVYLWSAQTSRCDSAFPTS